MIIFVEICPQPGLVRQKIIYITMEEDIPQTNNTLQFCLLIKFFVQSSFTYLSSKRPMTNLNMFFRQIKE